MITAYVMKELNSIYFNMIFWVYKFIVYSAKQDERWKQKRKHFLR